MSKSKKAVRFGQWYHINPNKAGKIMKKSKHSAKPNKWMRSLFEMERIRERARNRRWNVLIRRKIKLVHAS